MTCSALGICHAEGEDVTVDEEVAGPVEEVREGGDAFPEGGDGGRLEGSGCPAGMHRVYGSCVPDSLDEEPGGGGGGCQAGSGPAASAVALLLLLPGLLLLGRRRGGSMDARGRSCRGPGVAGWLLLAVLAGLGACAETRVVGPEDVSGPGDLPPPGDGAWRGTGDGRCLPDCLGRQCGDDGCGGSCGICPAGVDCEAGVCSGTCKDECSPAGASSCAADGVQECVQFDGDGCLEWGSPRPCPGFGHCEGGACVCVPDCLDKECGYDGCSGSCGSCPEGFQCVDYRCEGGCIDQCPEEGEAYCTETGRVICGDYDDDDCLEWGPEQGCQGPCVDGECQCEPSCAGKECGSDGCGGKCGSCPPGMACKEFLCTSEGTDCMPGAIDEQNCGLCGKRNRKCAADGTWGAWSDCLDEGVCKSGDQDEKACGKCGVQTRTCLADCQWGNWSYCVGEGLCAPGETQNESCGLCGQQSRSCDNQCQWGPWSGCAGEGVCVPGDEKTEACGNCGTRNRQCNNDCQWDPWGQCQSQGECSPGSTGVCGACGWQTCSPTCFWGPCQGEGQCVPGTVSTEGCPTCRARTCNNNCTFAAACGVCSGCTQFSKCGTSCPAGYHATGYHCDLGCGGSCWSDNAATCAPTCGPQITKCGTSCPSGYHPVNYHCNLSCGSSCWSDNAVTCQLTN